MGKVGLIYEAYEAWRRGKSLEELRDWLAEHGHHYDQVPPDPPSFEYFLFSIWKREVIYGTLLS